jgi:hypothetical protein
MTKTGLEFEISVIVICLIFVICYLEFLFFKHSKTARHLYLQSHCTLISVALLDSAIVFNYRKQYH